MNNLVRHRRLIGGLLGLLLLTLDLPAQQTDLWELVDTTRNTYIVDALAAAGETDFVVGSVSNQLVRSSDAGATWKGTAIANATGKHHSIAHPTPEVIVAVGEIAEAIGDDQGLVKYRYQGVLRRSTDGGATWRESRTDSNSRLTALAMCDPLHGVAACQVLGNIHNTAPDLHPDSILVTDDGWATWRTVALPAGISHVPQILCLAPATFMLNAYDKQEKGYFVLTTTDAGATWSRSAPLPTGVRRISFLDAMNGWGAGGVSTGVGYIERDMIVRTTDGGRNWEVQLDKTVGRLAFGLNDVDFADADNGIAVGRAGKILRTRDGGKNWTQQNPPDGVPSDFGWVRYVRPDLAIVVSNIGPIIRYTGRQTLAAPKFVLPDKPGPLPVDKVTVAWTSVAGANRYHIVILPEAIDDDIPYQPLVDKITADTSLVLENLQYWHRYWASVRAVNDVQESDWYRHEGSALFYTMQQGSLLPPKILTPAPGAVNQPIAVTVTWEPITGATGYDIEVGSNQYFVDPPVFADSFLTATSRVVAPLGPDTEYFVRVRARLGDQITDWSSQYASHGFHTASPAAVPVDLRDEEPLVSIAPNPAAATARLTLLDRAAGRGGTVTLVDRLGVVVREIELTRGATTLDLRTDDLPAGSYLLRLASGDTISVARLVVIR